MRQQKLQGADFQFSQNSPAQLLPPANTKVTLIVFLALYRNPAASSSSSILSAALAIIRGACSLTLIDLVISRKDSGKPVMANRRRRMQAHTANAVGSSFYSTFDSLQ